MMAAMFVWTIYFFLQRKKEDLVEKSMGVFKSAQGTRLVLENLVTGQRAHRESCQHIESLIARLEISQQLLKGEDF